MTNTNHIAHQHKYKGNQKLNTLHAMLFQKGNKEKARFIEQINLAQKNRNMNNPAIWVRLCLKYSEPALALKIMTRYALSKKSS